jgi:hypothetical protein
MSVSFISTLCRIVGASEIKVLHEQLRWCYHKEGVNHYEACKDLVQQILSRKRAGIHQY